MSYRYTNTEKWGDSWFSGLTQLQMLLFIYLCDNCDIAGFIEINLKRWATDLNSNPSTIEGALKGLERGLTFSKDESCVFINNFLKHQKNLPINDNNKAHIGILKRFELYRDKFGIQHFTDLIFKPLPSPIEGASKGLPSPTGIGNGIGNGIEKGVQGEKLDKIEKTAKALVKKHTFTPPLIEEVILYFKQNLHSEELAKRAFQYYEVAKWHDSTGRPVKNWKQKMIAVWFPKEETVKVIPIQKSIEELREQNQKFASKHERN